MNGPIPSSEGAQLPWLQNFCVKLPSHAATLGLVAAQTSSATADCNMLIYLIQTFAPTLRNDAAEAVRYKDVIKNGPIGTPSGGIPAATALPVAPPAVAAGALVRLRLLVQEIKNKATFNNAIGADLGILTSTPGADNSPPVISVTDNHASHVVMTWSKQGWTGVKVQGRAQGAATWTELGQDLYSPFIDTRPLATPGTPEVREYRMCHLDGDDALLNWSTVTVVTVVP